MLDGSVRGPRQNARGPPEFTIVSYCPSSMVALVCLSSFSVSFSIFLFMDEFQWFLMALSVLFAHIS
jgi:hypothetical protein